jgi:hypothetical protein
MKCFDSVSTCLKNYLPHHSCNTQQWHFQEDVTNAAQCHQLLTVVLNFTLVQPNETNIIYDISFQGFVALVTQMMVIFWVWHCVVCTDISKEHTATIFRVCDMDQVNA